MGLFDFLKDKPTDNPNKIEFPVTLGAPVKGTVVPMCQIPDEVFSTGVLGSCCGIDPNEGKVYAPIAGKVTQLTDTLHAIGITAGGMEILIHVGVDTVDMDGDGFSNAVQLNAAVKKGDLLLTMDLDKIRAAGHPTTVIMAVTNSDEFSSVVETGSGAVSPGDTVLQINR